MKADLADKECLEQKRAQHEEEAREKCKLISEQKAVSVSSSSPIKLCLLIAWSVCLFVAVYEDLRV